uniref:Uncharacterized protein n=1 Tax=Moniliophthora roreri TaxID=221103 RepID=A0A0W0FLP6_MONRR
MFQTPFGMYRLVKLPMRWTNLVPIFHEDVCEILKNEIPQKVEGTKRYRKIQA